MRSRLRDLIAPEPTLEDMIGMGSSPLSVDNPSWTTKPGAFDTAAKSLGITRDLTLITDWREDKFQGLGPPSAAWINPEKGQEDFIFVMPDLPYLFASYAIWHELGHQRQLEVDYDMDVTRLILDHRSAERVLPRREALFLVPLEADANLTAHEHCEEVLTEPQPGSVGTYGPAVMNFKSCKNVRAAEIKAFKIAGIEESAIFEAAEAYRKEKRQ